MSIDRRTAPRIELLGRLHGQIASLDVSIDVREISLGGLSMATTFPFPEGAVHEFRLTLGDESAVVLRGRVVYCRESQAQDGGVSYISGVQFLDDEPSDSVDDLIGRVS